MQDGDLVRAAGVLLGSAGPLAVASLLGSVRDRPTAVIAVFALMAGVVAAAGGLAGFVAGATSAVIATLSFDFFFVRPYLVLELDSVDDLRVALVFATVGLGAAALTRRTRRRSVDLLHGPTVASRHVARVLGLIKQGADPSDLVLAVQAELTSLLGLRGCRFEPGGSTGRVPRLERDGAVMTADGRVLPSDLSLPAEDLQLAVRAGRRLLGIFVLQPTPGASVRLEHRLQAVLLADHLAAALVPRGPHGGTTALARQDVVVPSQNERGNRCSRS